MGMASGVGLCVGLLPVWRRFGVMTTVSPVQEKMKQRTGEQEKIREHSEHMCPVFRDEKKSQDREKGAQDEPSYQPISHRMLSSLHR